MRMLDDHVVLVVGGGSGLGLGVARHCLKEGASVAILEIVPAKVEALRQEFGDGVLVLQGDATSTADLETTKEAVLQRWGRLDAYIGCQGIFDGNVPLKDTAVERLDSLFDEIFRINVLAYIKAARIFVDELEKTNGAIVLTSSVASLIADGGGLMYTATKGAVSAVIRQLAFEYAPRVRVNGVAPGGIGDSQLRGPEALGLEGQKQSDIPRDVFLSVVNAVSPMQTLPSGEDHGPLYAFLASHRNNIATGSVYLADQGSTNRAFLSAGFPH